MADGLYNPGVAQATVDALAATIPAPSATMPPGVSDSGSIGVMSPYARSDHTHAAKTRRQKITGVNTSTYVWTFPTAFAAGVVPVINGFATDPAAVATDSYNVQGSGTPSNTQATFRIVRQTAGLGGLLLGALAINPTPGTVTLDLEAFEP